MSDNKKTILAVGGAAVLLAGIALWYSKSSSKADPTDDILKDANLETPVRTKSGKIDRDYFLSLLQLIGVEVRSRTAEVRAICLKDRRAAYLDGDWKEYRVIVKAQIEAEEKAQQDLTKMFLPKLEITTEEFQTLHDQLANDPIYAEHVMAAQGKLSGPLENEAEPKITKEETIKVFAKQQEKSL